MVMEILAREKCGLLWCLRNVLCPWRHPLDLHRDNPAVAAFLRYRKMQLTATTLATLQMFGVYSGWKSVDNYDTCASVFVFLFNGFVTHKLLWCYVQILTLQKPHIPASFNMYLEINKWVISVKVSNFSGQYLHNHSTSDIGVLGYICTVWPKEHSPEVKSFPPGTPCIAPRHALKAVKKIMWLAEQKT